MFAVFGVEMSDPVLIRFVRTRARARAAHTRARTHAHTTQSLLLQMARRECLDMGVEIIFSDSPDIARDTINKWKRERQPSQSR